ncbi:hypothetical protein [Aliarcobacter cryaerophilus]|nr:hypothetical protein [Aliarcobacter cryaerophilus]MCT7492284.1 hypothetical protein [Aliarcobacter cryaerophilus]
MEIDIFEVLKESFWIILGIIIVSILTYIRYVSKKVYYKIKTNKTIYKNDKYDGIIFTTGFNYTLQRHIINHVKPEFVGILTTEQNENNTKEFIKEFSNIKFKCKYISELDIEEIQDECNILVKWLLKNNVKKEKIAIDLTGGQVPFSLATYQSGKNLDIDIIYTKSSYDKGKLLDGTQKSILIGNKK